MIMSLFTTGGRFNPMALVPLIFTILLAYQHLAEKSENRELKRQVKVLSESSKDKVKTLNEFINDQKQASKIIDNGSFDNDFLKQLQDLD